MSSPVNPIPLPPDPIAKPKAKPFQGRTLSDVIAFLSNPATWLAYVTDKWLEYLSDQAQIAAESTSLAAPVFVAEDQTATIAATDLSDGALAEGYYEVDVYLTVNRAAGTSMSLAADVDFTDGGQTKNLPQQSSTTNATTTVVVLHAVIHIDNASPVRLTVTYGSVGAPAMRYDARAVLRRVA